MSHQSNMTTYWRSRAHIVHALEHPVKSNSSAAMVGLSYGFCTFPSQTRITIINRGEEGTIIELHLRYFEVIRDVTIRILTAALPIRCAPILSDSPNPTSRVAGARDTRCSAPATGRSRKCSLTTTWRHAKAGDPHLQWASGGRSQVVWMRCGNPDSVKRDLRLI